MKTRRQSKGGSMSERKSQKEEKREENDVLPKRVTLARQAAGLSLSEASKNLGFKNYQTLSNIEKGERKINANELSAMARLYRRSLDYFFATDISPDPEPLWRKTTDIGLRAIQREFIAFLENYSGGGKVSKKTMIEPISQDMGSNFRNNLVAIFVTPST
jgi:transcriptional regulator with XRE-family HTH domain